jgi:hypothetical protein
MIVLRLAAAIALSRDSATINAANPAIPAMMESESLAIRIMSYPLERGKAGLMQKA